MDTGSKRISVSVYRKKLNTFLEKSKTFGDHYTYGSINPPGNYLVENTEIEEFWDLYSDCIYHDPLSSYTLTEKPELYIPILSDCDFKIGVDSTEFRTMFPNFQDPRKIISRNFDEKEKNLEQSDKKDSKNNREEIKTDEQIMAKSLDEISKSLQMYKYKEIHKIKLLKIYNTVLEKIGKNTTDDNFICAILEKNKIRFEDGYIKFGFHMHYLYSFMDSNSQDVHLIPRVKVLVDEQKIFHDLGISKSSTVIDESCTRKHWMLYGSKKFNPNPTALEAYKITSIYNRKLEKISLADALKNYKLYDTHGNIIPLLLNSSDKVEKDVDKNIGLTTDLLRPKTVIESTSNKSTSNKDEKHFVKNILEFKSHPLEYYLPRIMSIKIQHRSILELKDNLECLIKNRMKKAEDTKYAVSNLSVVDQLSQAESFLKIISGTRADEYQSWISIGLALYTVSNGCVEGLELWDGFSKKTSRKNYYSEQGCIVKWQSFTSGSCTMGTLRYFAEQDNKDKYDMISNKYQKKKLMDGLNGGHDDLARLLYENYDRKYVCANIKENIWYEFKNHGWSQISEGYSLQQLITSDLVKKYTKMGKDVYTKMGEEKKKKKKKSGEESDEDRVDADEKAMQSQQKQILKIVCNLKSAPFIKNIMTLCKIYFFREKFIETLDTNINCIRCPNGVIDLEKKKFRDGQPEDMLSLSTGIEYKIYKEDSEEMQMLRDFYEKLYPDPDLNRYIREYDANLLKGGNTSKVILIMSGDGDNGKSVKIDLMGLMLGEYFSVLPTSTVTGKRTQSSGHTAELDGLRGVRFVVLQEPNRRDVFNVGIFKELTGNDTIYIRGMYSKKSKLKPLFKVAVICNKLPKMPADEDAIWNRMDVLLHESWFPKKDLDCPKDPEDQIRKKIFPRDNFFNEKLPKLAGAALYQCFEDYKILDTYGKTPKPAKVTIATENYKRTNDVFTQFKADCLYKEDEENKEEVYISVKECYALFKDWYKLSYPNLISFLPSGNEFEEDMSKRLGQIVKRRWYGYREKTEADEEKEGTILRIVPEDHDEVKRKSKEKNGKEKNGKKNEVKGRNNSEAIAVKGRDKSDTVDVRSIMKSTRLE